MVVPVLIISCQVFEKLNAGPVTAQIMMTRIAIVNAHALPRMVAGIAGENAKCVLDHAKQITLSFSFF